jgi:preprotein translocase subunit YajC
LNNTLYYVIIFVLFIAIFYFMGIRPQQKQRRAHQQLMSSLKKGDQVMTASGIYGTVKRVDDTVVVIEVAKGVTMKVARRAIADIVRDSAQARAIAPESSSPTARRGSRAAEDTDYEDAASEGTTLGDETGSETQDGDSDK